MKYFLNHGVIWINTLFDLDTFETFVWSHCFKELMYACSCKFAAFGILILLDKIYVRSLSRNLYTRMIWDGCALNEYFEGRGKPYRSLWYIAYVQLEGSC